MSRHATYNPVQPDATIRALVSGQPDIKTITTPSSAGVELAIEHGLGRIPKGLVILSTPYTGTAPAHGPTTTSATNQFLYWRFSVTSTEMTVAIF